MTVPDSERMTSSKRLKELEADIASHARCLARGGDPLNGGEFHLRALVDLTAEYDEIIERLFPSSGQDARAHYPALLAQVEAEG